jgi:hypothetical protein
LLYLFGPKTIFWDSDPEPTCQVIQDPDPDGQGFGPRVFAGSGSGF